MASTPPTEPAWPAQRYAPNAFQQLTAPFALQELIQSTTSAILAILAAKLVILLLRQPVIRAWMDSSSILGLAPPAPTPALPVPPPPLAAQMAFTRLPPPLRTLSTDTTNAVPTTLSVISSAATPSSSTSPRPQSPESLPSALINWPLN